MSDTRHDDGLSAWIHDHIFDEGSRAAERGTRLVMWITAAMMVVEIAAGWWFNSMALLADGWHMSSHALAIGLSAFAYSAARKYAKDTRFAFGTWKIEILAGYTSAVFLLGIAALMAFSSVERILSPQPIHYREAIVIAAIGLIVNIVCAFILGDAHHHGDHGHDHGHHHGHAEDGHHHHDLNLRSAYVHVIADAATSVLAIAALLGGWLYGWAWLDPVMGIVGAVLVAVWAKSLMADTGKVLLDREMDAPVVEEIREVIEDDVKSGETTLVDLHVWRVGRQAYSCALSIVTSDPDLTANQIRDRLAVHEEIVHSTVEIHHRRRASS
ncbi:MAG TPA: CDF family Co(II)/Ni(II) efflux transporter DmeF [Noviherbaspirillum sp.]|uniref:CDF family Co(II)/Ni(II) efflux transporter DmeF n=1 Tax=Noviherbaspirillum sp. TaxID=1926288 RepID=UPI002B45DD33|nr:CDF family Co(II)/Ni(II) efflux transporter DmeF [Noviherbaspirillum sp.]HJV84217.1 CDF family Co(II)/Ni(II) efflux transporter DmeF [Noviherbaspirillum sp.]